MKDEGSYRSNRRHPIRVIAPMQTEEREEGNGGGGNRTVESVMALNVESQ